MSDAATAPLRVHRLTRLPDAFWQGVRETPWRYDLFQLLRRIDARAASATRWDARRCRNLNRCASASSRR